MRITEDLQAMLDLTDPNSSYDWQRWHSEVRPALADYLDRIDCPWASSVRGACLETRLATRNPHLISASGDWRDVEHVHDAITISGGNLVTALALFVNDRQPPDCGATVHVAVSGAAVGFYELVGDVPLMINELDWGMPLTLELNADGPAVDFTVAYRNVSEDLDAIVAGKLSGIGRLERRALLGTLLRNLAEEVEAPSS